MGVGGMESVVPAASTDSALATLSRVRQVIQNLFYTTIEKPTVSTSPISPDLFDLTSQETEMHFCLGVANNGS